MGKSVLFLGSLWEGGGWNGTAAGREGMFVFKENHGRKTSVRSPRRGGKDLITRPNQKGKRKEKRNSKNGQGVKE